MENQIDTIIDDINESRYETVDQDVNDIQGDNEGDGETPVFENEEAMLLNEMDAEEEQNIRPTRQHASTGVNRLEPTFSGQTHNNTNT